MSKIIGLIPSRLNSKRLHENALADIKGLAVIILLGERLII